MRACSLRMRACDCSDERSAAVQTTGPHAPLRTHLQVDGHVLKRVAPALAVGARPVGRRGRVGCGGLRLPGGGGAACCFASKSMHGGPSAAWAPFTHLNVMRPDRTSSYGGRGAAAKPVPPSALRCGGNALPLLAARCGAACTATGREGAAAPARAKDMGMATDPATGGLRLSCRPAHDLLRHVLFRALPRAMAALEWGSDRRKLSASTAGAGGPGMAQRRGGRRP